MALYFKIEGDKIVFFGDTFNHRPAIKELGARFNAADKTWIVLDSQETRQRAALIATPMQSKGRKTSPAQPPQSATKTTSPRNSNQIELDPNLGLTISQLLVLADKAVSQAFPTPIWVIGEIQSLSKRGGGTIYFDFAEAKTGAHETATITVKSNIWQNTATWLYKRHGQEKVEGMLADGNKLRALVHVKLYKDRGQITLSLEDIDPAFTQGALALARAELLRKLRKDGLDQKNKLLSIPNFPFRVALVTAEGSRAQSDFEHQLTSSDEFPGTILFTPCSMQGDKVPNAVTNALKAAERAEADLIVLCRGGGSAADLRWFDGEEIALAIAHSKVPIIAAIGHHEDTCVAEEICHTREKTPTAAADRILQIFRDSRSAINEKAHGLAVILDREMSQFDRLQSNLKEHLTTAAEHFFSSHRERLFLNAASLSRGFEGLVLRQSASFMNLAARLNYLANSKLQQLSELLSERHREVTKMDPSPWLKAGWTQLNIGGRNIRSLSEVSSGDTLSARLMDGILKLRVEEKQARSKS